MWRQIGLNTPSVRMAEIILLEILSLILWTDTRKSVGESISEKRRFKVDSYISTLHLDSETAHAANTVLYAKKQRCSSCGGPGQYENGFKKIYHHRGNPSPSKSVIVLELSRLPEPRQQNNADNWHRVNLRPTHARAPPGAPNPVKLRQTYS